MQLLVSATDGHEISEGFEFLSFRNIRLGRGNAFDADTEERELAIVILGGRCSVASSCGTWRDIGGRPNVFSGMPYALYLPLATGFKITAETECDLALCYSKATEHHPAQLVTPNDVEVEIRGAEMQPAKSTRS